MQTKASFPPLLARGLSLLLWMGVIFLFSALPGSEYPYTPTLSYFLERKGAHVVEYAALMFLAVRFVAALFPREAVRNILLLSTCFALAYAVSDELHQFFVPYRGAKMSDVLIDGLGIALMGTLLWLAADRHKRRR